MISEVITRLWADDEAAKEMTMDKFRYQVLVLIDDASTWELNAAFFDRLEAYEYARLVLEGCKTKIVECEGAYK